MANKKVIIGVSVSIGLLLIGLGIFLGFYLTRDKSIDEEDYTYVVNTNVGQIRGLRAVSDNFEYTEYLGIPYAEVDKSNPFGLSNEYPQFEGIFNANDDSAVCPQIDVLEKEAIGVIDCLTLNVYKPDTATSQNLLPVLIWLNGERFMSGISGKDLYGPKFLIQHDVILVSINYRLGAYGFMCTDIAEVPGNQGLKDQLLALKWIKNNIGDFGGNPNNITMFGHGDGAKSIDYHLISEQEILFNQAILQSGVAVAPPTVTNVDNSLPLLLAAKLGQNTNSVSEAVTYLAGANINDVLQAASELKDSFVPCIENDSSSKFLSDHPLNLSPRVRNMNILLGVTDNESVATFINEQIDLESLINDELVKNFNFDNSTLTKMVDFVRRFYLSDDPIDEENKYQIMNFKSDFEYLHPNQRRINDFLSNGANALYHYIFSYEGGRNFGKIRNGLESTSGALHGDELGYLFDIPMLSETISSADEIMIERMATMWTNFAKYGNPTRNVTELLPTRWERVTPISLNYFNISSDLSSDNRPFRRRLTFWDLFYKVNQEYELGRNI